MEALALDAPHIHVTPRSGMICAEDVRAMLRLEGELHELPPDPEQRRRHALRGLAALLGAQVTLAGESGSPVLGGERPFTERERLLVDIFHRESRALAPRDVRPSLPRGQEERLSPHLDRTLRALLRGLSEKQVAAELGLSQHTVHEYVKALYRRFGVRSRSELLARFVGTGAAKGGPAPAGLPRSPSGRAARR